MLSDSKDNDLGSLLTGVFQKKNWQRRMGLHQVFLFWDNVVGTEIAAHAQPKVIKGDVLWLNVSDSVWMQHLQFEKLSVLDRINDRLKGLRAKFADKSGKPLRISDLRFDISRTSLAKVKPVEKIQPAKIIDKKRLAEFEQLLAMVNDPKVKDSLRHLWLLVEGRNK